MRYKTTYRINVYSTPSQNEPTSQLRLTITCNKHAHNSVTTTKQPHYTCDVVSSTWTHTWCNLRIKPVLSYIVAVWCGHDKKGGTLYKRAM